MYLKLLPILLFFAIVLSACQKELPSVDNPQVSYRQIIEKAEQQVETAQQEALQLQMLNMPRIPANAVELPAGSVDGLAAAIAEAGKGGTVLVKAGEHLERGSVLITEKVSIIGEQGAVLISSVPALESIGYLQAALHVKGAEGVLIYGLDIRADSDFGGTGIFLENAPKSFISHNTLTNFGFGIANHHGNHSHISKNRVVGSSAWQTDFALNVYGIVNINGDRVRIFNNEVSNNVFGIWPCDEKGLISGNTTNGNYIGIIFCKVPTFIPLPDGSVIGSENSGQDWIALHNTANGNFHVGIISIDGANNNLLVMNKAADNVDADVELASESLRFGFLTPTSYENTVISGAGIRIKNCGVDNVVHGGELIDLSLNPCY